MNRWIPVSEAMPEEHPTAVSKLVASGKYKGCDTKWAGFPQKMSDRVIATVVFPDDERLTLTAWTVDGAWKIDYALPFEVAAWMPFPAPYEEGE